MFSPRPPFSAPPPPQPYPRLLSAAAILASLKLHHDLHVELRSPQTSQHVLQPLPDEFHTVGGPVPEHPRDERVGVLLEPRDEVAALSVDAVEQPVAELAQVKQQQPLLHPTAYLQDGAVVLAARAELDAAHPLALHTHHHVELRGGLRVVRPARRKAPLQQVVEPHQRRVRSQHVTETLENPRQARRYLLDLLQQHPHHSAEELRQRLGEPVIKHRRHQPRAGGLLVRPAHPRQASLPASRKAQNNSPEQRRRLHLAASLYHPAPAGVLVDLTRRNQAGQLTLNSDRLPSGHGFSSFSQRLAN